MASRVEVNIDPLIGQRLTAVGGPIHRDMLRRVLRVNARAKQLCPVDTGRLRSSIRWELEGVGTTRLVGRISANTNYAVFVHEGTRYMSPRPFLREALDAARG